jgi:hypothetical protein
MASCKVISTGGLPGTGEANCTLRVRRHRDPLVAGAPHLIGAPGLDIVDLAGIAVAVEIDGELADAGFGENVKDQVLVVGAGVFGGCAGLDFGRVGHGCLPV